MRLILQSKIQSKGFTKIKVLIFAIIFLIIGGGVFLFVSSNLNENRGLQNKIIEISSYEECIKAGYPMTESNPRQCSTGAKTFVENLPLDNSSLILNENSNEPPLLLKSIGVELEEYNPETGMAGDLKFTKGNLTENLLFVDYGYILPAINTAERVEKMLHQPAFIVPLGTPVRSLVDGVVVDITPLYGDDYTIHVSTSKKSKWRYETEHVLNPIVKVGEQVKAGQKIGEVTNQDSQWHDGLGFVEIGILLGGSEPVHLCPFLYLDSSIKDDIYNKINSLYGSWEEYKNDDSLYDQDNNIVPGCRTDVRIPG